MPDSAETYTKYLTIQVSGDFWSQERFEEMLEKMKINLDTYIMYGLKVSCKD